MNHSARGLKIYRIVSEGFSNREREAKPRLQAYHFPVHYNNYPLTEGEGEGEQGEGSGGPGENNDWK